MKERDMALNTLGNNGSLATVITHTLNNGGGTFNAALQPINYSDGYMVAVTGIEIPVVDFNEESVQSFLGTANLSAPGALLGTWLNEGIVYIDITTHYTGIERAMEAGKDFDQLAIYDCAAGVSLSCETGEVV
jgi:hypothetical protein